MTDENQFGRYTLDELEDHARRAVEQEQQRTGKEIIFWAGIAYILGFLVGLFVA
jgi:tetrahydromethanopterin S-methyltransferase subunit G